MELRGEVDALRGRAEALALSADSLLQDRSAALRQVCAVFKPPSILHQPFLQTCAMSDARPAPGAQVKEARAEAEKGQEVAAEAAAQLRRDVAEALEAFSAGDLDADAFLEELGVLGVRVDCTPDALTLTSSAL